MGVDNFSGSNEGDSDNGRSSTSSNDTISAGLAAFSGNNDSSSGNNDSSSHGGGGDGSYPHHLVAESWTGKLDYSQHYITVAEDEDGEIYVHQSPAVVMTEHTDWRRLDDHPSKEFEVHYRCPTKQAWLQFCNRAQSQLDTDPRELLGDSPLKLAELRERVHYPSPGKPDQSRDCRVCGTNSGSDEVSMLEIDLQKNRRVPVCASHTVADLAREGLLE